MKACAIDCAPFQLFHLTTMHIIPLILSMLVFRNPIASTFNNPIASTFDRISRELRADEGRFPSDTISHQSTSPKRSVQLAEPRESR